MKAISNDELRHEWRLSLQQQRGLSGQTIVAKLAALSAYERFTNGRRFAGLRRDDVRSFKEHLLDVVSAATGKKLARSTYVHTLAHCLDFFRWFGLTRSGRKIDQDAVAWFHPSRADKERARAATPKPVPTFADARAAFAALPAETMAERRARAIFAALLLTAARADALASLPIGSVDCTALSVRLDATTVRTKYARSFTIFFLPFFPEAQAALLEWVAELRGFGLGENDALFPRDTELQRLAAGEHLVPGPFPCWSGSAQVRAIVRHAFAIAGLPVHSPHVFRHMITRHALALDPGAEELIAISINLGHKRLETTFNPYGRPDDARRADLIAGLGRHSRTDPAAGKAEFLADLARTRPEAAASIIAILAEPIEVISRCSSHDGA